MSVISVSTSSELLSAISKAKAGDTISLKSGTYNGINLSNVNVAGNVTITSANADKPAVLGDLMIKNSSGFTFSNLEFAPQSVDRAYTFQVLNSSNINFSNLNVHGPAGEVGYDSSPFMIRNSSNVSVTNSDFSHLWHGINMLDSTGVTLVGNSFQDIRTDGIRGGGNSNVVISDNYFTNFVPQTGDHPDAIQLWTGGTTSSASNITITDNVVYRGDGAAVQGIFLRDQVGTVPYQNVTVTGNLIVGGMGNGISLDHVIGGVVSNNTVAGLNDDKSWVMVKNSTGVAVDHNSATTYLLDDNNSNVAITNNSTIPTVYDGGLSTVTKWVSTVSSLLKLPVELTSLVGTVKDTQDKLLASQPLMTVINGTAGVDRLTVTNMGNSRLVGGEGNDILTGGRFNNELIGGNGDDTYNIYGAGDKVIETANGGNDTVKIFVNHTMADNVETLRMGLENLTAHGNSLANRMIGTDGADTFYGHGGNDTIQGLGGNDYIWGGEGDDTISGDDGNDYLYGEAGNDKLLGGAGNDVLNGGAGNDTLEGGAGVDTLTGGAGADTFLFREGDLAAPKGQMDTITDFSSADGDRISLNMIDANIKTAVDDKFKFLGTAAFSHTAGELRYEVVNGNAIVMGDTNGDGVADFQLKLLNVSKLAAADFVL
jgi:Ca2+-binding RTX toxin-like protein